MGGCRLGVLFSSLGPRGGFDGAERSVEPGLLGGLNLVNSEAQMVLQVLLGTEKTTNK